MRAFAKIYPASRSRILRSCAAVAVILFCIYVGIFHMQSYSDDNLSFLGIVLGGNNLIFLVRIWVDDNSLNVWKRLLLSLTVLLIIIFSFMGVEKLREAYYAYELSKYGQATTGEVKAVYTPDFEWFDGHAVVRYTFNDQNYIQRIEDKDGKYIMGDQLQLIASSRNPEIIRVIGQKQN